MLRNGNVIILDTYVTYWWCSSDRGRLTSCSIVTLRHAWSNCRGIWQLALGFSHRTESTWTWRWQWWLGNPSTGDGMTRRMVFLTSDWKFLARWRRHLRLLSISEWWLGNPSTGDRYPRWLVFLTSNWKFLVRRRWHVRLLSISGCSVQLMMHNGVHRRATTTLYVTNLCSAVQQSIQLSGWCCQHRTDRCGHPARCSGAWHWWACSAAAAATHRRHTHQHTDITTYNNNNNKRSK